MKTLFKKGILAAAIALAINTAYSQVPDQWTRTLQFEGYWEGPATLNAGGQTFNLFYHTDFKTILDGAGMTMDEGFTDAALGEVKGANLIGLYAGDGLIHWESVDNLGTAHEHTGSWINQKHFYMEHHGPQGGQAYSEYIDIRLRANNHRVVLNLVATLDGDTVETLTGTLVRQNNCRISNRETETEKSEITIYPNPNNGEFDITSATIIDEIKITNESGALVYEEKPNETDYSIKLNTAGIYFVHITSANKTETQKIIVIK